MKISVIISARDEFPNIVHTVHAIINDLETWLSPGEFEIIVVDNGSNNPDSWRFLAERGMYHHRTVKILHDPIMGNVTARNKGVEIAEGEFIFFSDAHMSYRIGAFKEMVRVLEKYGGIVHPSVQWMGGYEPSGRSYQYSLKLGEKLWGTWNNRIVGDGQNPFYIPVSGHCCLGVRKSEFLKLGRYNDYFRCYGGGELYLDLKWWILGSTVMCVPSAVAYHLSAGRGYHYMQDDFIHNMMLLAQSLGAHALAERVYLRYLGKHGVNPDSIKALYEQARREAELDPVQKQTKMYSLYQLITERPWDQWNMALHGKASSGILIYDRTWVDDPVTGLKGEARQLFDSSSLQAELQHLIDTEWSQLVYKGL